MITNWSFQHHNFYHVHHSHHHHHDYDYNMIMITNMSMTMIMTMDLISSSALIPYLPSAFSSQAPGFRLPAS